MGRLTDRKTATELKENVEKLRAVGIEPTISDLRYIKLAEYENVEEFIETTTHAPVLSYQTAAIKAVLEGKKAINTICDKSAIYAIDENPQEETKQIKENPALTPFMKDDKQLQEKKYCKDCIYHRFLGKWLFCDKYDVPVVFPNSCDDFIPENIH